MKFFSKYLVLWLLVSSLIIQGSQSTIEDSRSTLENLWNDMLARIGFSTLRTTSQGSRNITVETKRFLSSVSDRQIADETMEWPTWNLQIRNLFDGKLVLDYPPEYRPSFRPPLPINRDNVSDPDLQARFRKLLPALENKFNQMMKKPASEQREQWQREIEERVKREKEELKALEEQMAGYSIEKEWTGMLDRTGYDIKKHGTSGALRKIVQNLIYYEIIMKAFNESPGEKFFAELPQLALEMLNRKIPVQFQSWQGEVRIKVNFKRALRYFESTLKDYVQTHQPK